MLYTTAKKAPLTRKVQYALAVKADDDSEIKRKQRALRMFMNPEDREGLYTALEAAGYVYEPGIGFYLK